MHAASMEQGIAVLAASPCRLAANTAINNSPQQYSETGKRGDLAAYPRLEDARNQVSRIHKAPIIADIRRGILSSTRRPTPEPGRAKKRVPYDACAVSGCREYGSELRAKGLSSGWLPWLAGIQCIGLVSHGLVGYGVLGNS